MRIVIDLQGAQGSNRHRGIGRYSLSLAQAIIRNKDKHEVIVALNGLFPDTIEPIRAALEGFLPQDNIRVWYAPGPVCHIESANNWRRRTAELIREAFLASLQPDIVYVTSLFEGLVDDAGTSIGLLTQTIPTAVTLYDLIPLINRTPYLDNPAVESWYENKLDQLRRADILLAISESSRQESIKYLGFPQNQTFNVGTAADPQFRCIDINSAKERSLRERYGLSRAFVMYTGGIDHRKNIEGLIRAYAKLAKPLRAKHQLAIVCSVQPPDKARLEAMAKEQGLAAEEVVLTGFVPEDDLIALYNLCKTLVFPSWHEGFGLPALEAMCCGRAVIAANTSSLPEVIGRNDALFDPHSDESIANKLAQVLCDDSFRKQLEQHALKQAKNFSWDASAKAAIAAIEVWHASRTVTTPASSVTGHRPKLAFVSPLPPERSGISDYSAELMPELARHYEIEVIVAQDSVSDPWVNANCPVHTVEWFKAHTDRYERVLYHFGNSDFHQHMFDLIAEVPGVVVLHDFFLSGIVVSLDAVGLKPNAWVSELYHAHGYRAVHERFHAKDSADVFWRYPCNKSILENATGVIVHSDNSLRLATQWLGGSFAKNWSVIPHLRIPTITEEREEARTALNINENAFMVCSFGLLGPHKQNRRLLDAWLASTLAKDDKCVLVFVGENNSGDYGADLTATIRNSGLSDRIRITGWTDMAQFRQYLAAADVGVQLRTLSRGETSGTALNCMKYGLPTIVNANGALADLPSDAVWMLPDEFDDADLTKALDTLWKNEQKRHALGHRAREVILAQYAPRTCADQYAQAIERYYEQSLNSKAGLVKAIAQIEGAPTDEQDWLTLAKDIASNQPPPTIRQLLVDVSELVQRDAKSGIQRVVRAILCELLNNPPAGYRVEPIYATKDHLGYRYARQFTLRFLDCPDQVLTDESVMALNGDIFLGLDLQPHVVPYQAEYYQHLRRIGVRVHFVVYDLLPILRPDVFPDGATDTYTAWLSSLMQADGAVCISQAVADEVAKWLAEFGPERVRPFKLGWFHLGADVERSVPTKGLPSDSKDVLHGISGRPTFLMVGTLEPRKGQAQVLAAFERLWHQGVDVNLVMVGKQGWMVDKLISTLHNHAERNRRLFWLDGISDEYLEKIYAGCTCLIAASEGEGFGLPLIEAAQHKVPIIARDIPVFREVAGESAFYFSGLEAADLANAVKDWLSLDNAGKAPQSGTLPWLTWAQSTQQLLDVVLNDNWMTRWMPDGGYRYFGSDARLHSVVGRKNNLAIQTTGKAGCLLFGPYRSLPAGRYQVRLHGQVKRSGTPTAYVDTAIHKGNEVLSSCTYVSSPNVGLIAEMECYLKTAVTDFEVRVWVASDSDLNICKLEILPEALFDQQAASLPSLEVGYVYAEVAGD